MSAKKSKTFFKTLTAILVLLLFFGGYYIYSSGIFGASVTENISEHSITDEERLIEYEEYGITYDEWGQSVCDSDHHAQCLDARHPRPDAADPAPRPDPPLADRRRIGSAPAGRPAAAAGAPQHRRADELWGFALRPACNKPPAAVCHDLRLTMGFFRPFQVGCFLYGGFGYLVVR